MLIYDLVNPQEIQGLVRGVQLELERNQFVLQQFLPNENIDEIEYRYTTGQLQDQNAAVVRAWDTESPLGTRQGVKRVMGELPPISKKMRLGEEERLRLRMLERGNNNAQEIVNAIYDDATNLARSVTARVEMFRGEALETGEINIDENGVVATIDFGRSSSHDAGSNTATGTDVWTDYANADPVEFLQGLVDTYLATNGIVPGLFLTSRVAINHLLRNEKLRVYAGGLTGSPTLISRSQLAQVLQAFDLPPLVAYDVVTRVDGTQTRVISDDKVIGLPPAGEPLGRTFFGTTAEAIELVGAAQIDQAQAPGMISVVEKTFDPVATWTKVAAVALPILANPDLSIVGDVF